MEKCKTKTIQANLTIFTHIHAYSGIRTYPEEYSELWFIQNPVKH